MDTPIYTIGSGKRFQYAQDDRGYWWKRNKLTHGGWGAWLPMGTKTRPDNIWYTPSAGKAHLAKE